MVELPITEPAPERSRLGFATAVSKSFGFLLRSGFDVVELSDTFVRFESAHRVVRVFHGRASYELGVEIGRWIDVRGTRREQIFPLRDVISLTHDPEDVGFRGTTATTVDTVRTFVELLAGLTQRYASRLLDDGDDVFAELSARNAARGLADREAQRARLLRTQADTAWRDRDFASVVDCYVVIDEELETVELRQSERGRLDYARRALGG